VPTAMTTWTRRSTERPRVPGHPLSWATGVPCHPLSWATGVPWHSLPSRRGPLSPPVLDARVPCHQLTWATAVPCHPLPWTLGSLATSRSPRDTGVPWHLPPGHWGPLSPAAVLWNTRVPCHQPPWATGVPCHQLPSLGHQGPLSPSPGMPWSPHHPVPGVPGSLSPPPWGVGVPVTPWTPGSLSLQPAGGTCAPGMERCDASSGWGHPRVLAGGDTHGDTPLPPNLGGPGGLRAPCGGLRGGRTPQPCPQASGGWARPFWRWFLG